MSLPSPTAYPSTLAAIVVLTPAIVYMFGSLYPSSRKAKFSGLGDEDRELIKKSISDAIIAEFQKPVLTNQFVQLVVDQVKKDLDISSVESRLLIAINEGKESTESTISSLRSSAEKDASTTNEKLNALQVLFEAKSEATTDTLLKALAGAVSTITTSLEQLGSDIKIVREQVTSAGSEASAQGSKLLDTISAEVTGNATRFSGLQTQLESAIDAIKVQDITLAEIKAIDSDILSESRAASAGQADLKATVGKVENEVSSLRTSDITAAIFKEVKDSNESQAKHVTTLEEISTAVRLNDAILTEVRSSSESIGEIKTIVSKAVDFSPLETSIQNVSSTVAEIKTAVDKPAPAAEKTDLTPIQTSVEKLSAKLDEHTGTLDEIKSAAQKADLAGLETSVDKLLATLAEVKAGVDKEAPVAEKVDLAPLSAALVQHGNDLSDIKSVVSASAEKTELPSLKASVEKLSADLAEIKAAVGKEAPAADKVDLAPLISTLDAHSAHLTDIKGLVTNAEKTDLSSLETSVGNLNTTLEGHSSHLTDIKGSLTAPAVAEKTDLSGLEGSLGEIKTLIQAIPTTAGKDDAILESVASLKSLVEAIPPPSKDFDDAQILASIASVQSAVNALPTPSAPKEIKDDEILASVQDVKDLVKALPAPVAPVPSKDDDIISSIAAVQAAIKDISAPATPIPGKDDEILTSIASLETHIKAIPTSAPADKSEDILTEIKSVKSATEETQKETAAITKIVEASIEKDILNEVQVVKALIEKQKAVVSVKEVGEDDKGVAVNGNGVTANEVSAEA